MAKDGGILVKKWKAAIVRTSFPSSFHPKRFWSFLVYTPFQSIIWPKITTTDIPQAITFEPVELWRWGKAYDVGLLVLFHLRYITLISTRKRDRASKVISPTGWSLIERERAPSHFPTLSRHCLTRRVYVVDEIVWSLIPKGGNH